MGPPLHSTKLEIACSGVRTDRCTGSVPQYCRGIFHGVLNRRLYGPVNRRLHCRGIFPRKFQVSSCGPVEALATHTDDASGCGEPGVFFTACKYLARRSGGLKVHEEPFVHVGMGLPQDDDFSVQKTREIFTDTLKPIPTSLSLWASRKRLWSGGYGDQTKEGRRRLRYAIWLVSYNGPKNSPGAGPERPGQGCVCV